MLGRMHLVPGEEDRLLGCRGLQGYPAVAMGLDAQRVAAPVLVRIR